MIKVNSTNVDETRHFAHLDERQLHAIIIDAVAKAAGVNPANKGVKVAKCYLSTKDSVGAGIERYAEVEIVVDHRPQTAPESAG